MPIVNQKAWDNCVAKNADAYGGCCVNVARRCMEILDKEPGDIDCHKIICRSDVDVKAGGITGFMAGCVASIISQCHSRGEEFRRLWNKEYQLGDEGDKANESGDVINPALLCLGEKEQKSVTTHIVIIPDSPKSKGNKK